MSRFDRPTAATRFRLRSFLIRLAVIGLLVAGANVLAWAESSPVPSRSA